MEFEDGEGDAGLNALEGIQHHHRTAPQGSGSLAPARGDVDDLEGMHEVSRGGGATVMY